MKCLVSILLMMAASPFVATVCNHFNVSGMFVKAYMSYWNWAVYSVDGLMKILGI